MIKFKKTISVILVMVSTLSLGACGLSGFGGGYDESSAPSESHGDAGEGGHGGGHHH